jgi:hypothetical protein
VYPTDREAFYADDYLLFPAMPRHVQHICPDVRTSYRPHFRRAVQALRTETPANAARWVGALLHFTTDTGSPPHALGILGDVHSKMENWVNAKRIALGDYQPRLLGETEEEALEGYLKRMEGLIAYSKERAEKLRPLVEKGDRAAVEPGVLECALETARVTADLLHTLGHLSRAEPAGTGTLRGAVTANPAPGLEKVLAKVVLEGTAFSTLADPAGGYEFRRLPPGKYRVAVSYPGAVATESLTLAAGEAKTQDFFLAAAGAKSNLVRNPTFRLHWVRPDLPDGWYRKTTADRKTEWEGETVPVQAGRRYRLSADWKPGARGEAVLLWHTGKPLDQSGGLTGLHYYPPTKKADAPLTAPAAEQTFVVPAGARSVQVVFRGSDAPDVVCDRISLTPVADPK